MIGAIEPGPAQRAGMQVGDRLVEINSRPERADPPVDLIALAAEAGCAILLEKPISHSLERIAELQAAAKHSFAFPRTPPRFRIRR